MKQLDKRFYKIDKQQKVFMAAEERQRVNMKDQYSRLSHLENLKSTSHSCTELVDEVADQT